MLLEYAQRPFERMEHRLSNRRGVASIYRMLDDYALASNVGPHFNGWPGQDDCESSNPKITQLVRLAALECAKPRDLPSCPSPRLQ
jgi:hypothetical protein